MGRAIIVARNRVADRTSEKARLGSAATERITHFPGCSPLCFIRVGSDKTDGRGILLVCRLKSARLVCAWSLTSITRLERDTASTEVIGPRKWRCVKVKPGRMDARLRQATSRSRKANEWPRIIPGLCSPLNAPKDLDAQHPHLHRYALTTFSPRAPRPGHEIYASASFKPMNAYSRYECFKSRPGLPVDESSPALG